MSGVLSSCVRCGAPIERRLDPRGKPEPDTRYSKRKYCSPSCYRAHLAEQALARREAADRHCQACGALMQHRANESPAMYAARRYCGHSCAAKAQRLDPDYTVKQKRRAKSGPPKRPITRTPCEYCGELRPIKAYDHPGTYASRRFCGNACANAARRLPDSVKAARREAKLKRAAARRRDREGLAAIIALENAAEREPFKPPMHPEAGKYRMQTLGTPCARHPGETVGIYGCPACNADARWRQQQHRQVVRVRDDGRLL